MACVGQSALRYSLFLLERWETLPTADVPRGEEKEIAEYLNSHTQTAEVLPTSPLPADSLPPSSFSSSTWQPTLKGKA